MDTLKIDSNSIKYDLDKLSKKWESLNNVYIELCLVDDKCELHPIINLLLNNLSSLSYVILSEISSKYKNLDEEDIENIFFNGDKACRVSICLRDNLPEKIKKECLSSNDLDIISHYRQKNNS